MATTHHTPAASVLPPEEGATRPSKRRTYGAAILSGLLLVAAFPHLDIGWLAWIAFIPLLSTYPHARFRTALAQALLFGFVYFGGLLYWIALFSSHIIGLGLGIAGWLIGTLAQVTVMILFALGAHLLSRARNWWFWGLGVSALWTALEWIRQLGELGTGWGDLAYSQHLTLPILQVTKLTGVWGLSFLIVLVNVALAGIISRRSPPKFSRITALVLLAAFLYGTFVMNTENVKPQYVAAALQTNIDANVQLSYQSPEYSKYLDKIMTAYMGQTDVAAAHGARLVVWPETAFSGDLRRDTQHEGMLAAQAVRNRQAVLVGDNEFDANLNADGNALAVINPNGKLTGSYLKRQLVPFGEYVPGRKWLGFLEALHVTIYDRKEGAAHQALLDAGSPVGKVGAAICYESSYSRLTQEQVARGAQLLVIVTDDTWFGRTAAARQHAAIAAVRAVESDRYLIRSASTGISQVIDPTGRVLAEAPLFQSQVVMAPVESRNTKTLFVQCGDWFVWVCFGILAVIALASSKKPTP